ncbi:unnamed protein product [Withania somnifera]
MGRAKLKMEVISKEKSRNATFKRRKEGLLKKLYEFTTLCNVNGLMILYGPNGSNSEPDIWSNSCGSNTCTKSLQQEEIQNMIDEYKKESNLQSTGNTKTFGLSDYFVNRNKKVEEELRKMNMDKRYPCWLDFMDQLPEFDLRKLLTILDDKVEEVKYRMNVLKGNFSSEYLMEGEMIDFGGGGQATRLGQSTHYNDNVMVQGGTEVGGYNQHEQLQVPIYPYCNSIISTQEMMMLMMNKNDCPYNAASSGIGSNNRRCQTMMPSYMTSNNELTFTIGSSNNPAASPPSAMPQMQQSWRDNEPDEFFYLI